MTELETSTFACSDHDKTKKSHKYTLNVTLQTVLEFDDESD